MPLVVMSERRARLDLARAPNNSVCLSVCSSDGCGPGLKGFGRRTPARAEIRANVLRSDEAYGLGADSAARVVRTQGLLDKIVDRNTQDGAWHRERRREKPRGKDRMNLYFRLLRLLLTARLRGTIDMVGDESELDFRVLPNDLDLNMHMNNGRYFTLMDLGRVDLIARTGLLPVCLRRKWAPVVGAAKMNFMRPLNPFQKFHLRTRLSGWDEKWLYLEQSFVTEDGKIAALGTVKGLFRGRDGNVPTALIWDELGIKAPGTFAPGETGARFAERPLNAGPQ